MITVINNLYSLLQGIKYHGETQQRVGIRSNNKGVGLQ